MVWGKANGTELGNGSKILTSLKHMYLNGIKRSDALEVYNMTILSLIQFTLIYLSVSINYLFRRCVQ